MLALIHSERYIHAHGPAVRILLPPGEVIEAWVESARRASKIPKQRTGRSLRVGELHVANEAIYEEDKDDLPMVCRPLTANLRAGSVDSDQRL